ncbi:hypothetical protein [Rhizobium phage RHEph12]|nr:hypothetical protein [Rhizobium phage RHEph12]
MTTKLERQIEDVLMSIRTSNNHGAMRIIQSLVMDGFTKGVISSRNRPLESLDDLLRIFDYTAEAVSEAVSTPREYNKDFKGVYFRALHSRKGTRVVMGVPTIWDHEKNEGIRIWQKLGEIRRKNDGRFLALPRYKVSLFEEYNAHQIEWMDAHPRNIQHVVATLEEAQDFLLSLLPARVDRSTVKILTVDDVPKESPWHARITVAPHIRENMRAGLI